VLSKTAEGHRSAIADLERRLAAREVAGSTLREIMVEYAGSIQQLVLGASGHTFSLAEALGGACPAVQMATEGPERGLPCTPEQRRAVLQALGCRVVLDDGKVLVTLDVPVVTQSDCAGGIVRPLASDASRRL
jgi:hypothetical protein